MSKIKLSLKELDQALELAYKHKTVFHEDGNRNLSIIARMVVDGYYDADNGVMTAQGRAFYDSGGYSKERNRRILRQVLGWLFGILSGLLASWIIAQI